MAILKTILVLLLIYYGFKILFRFFGPVLLTYFTKKAGENFQRYFEQRQHTTQSTADGTVSIEKVPKKKSNDTMTGEYVDFEEIDE